MQEKNHICKNKKKKKKEIKIEENSSIRNAALIKAMKIKNSENVLLHKFGENYK